MRIAIFSDIHGNLLAFDACLADLKNQGGADVIVGAGDFCMDGPKPKRVLQRLNEIGARCVRGNSDRFIADPESEKVVNEGDLEQVAWQRKELGEKFVAWLSELPFELRFGEKDNQLLVVHANPANDYEHIWPDAGDAELERLIAGEEAQTIAFGHLHLPFARTWRGKLLVNVASAGLPKDGDPRAGYAILTRRPGGWEVKHRRVPFDVKKVATQLGDSGIPNCVEHVNTLRRHRYKKLKTIIP
ncbi:MAG: metallophosphoesterase family protein [Vulcanimicrobiaceae bacterium]